MAFDFASGIQALGQSVAQTAGVMLIEEQRSANAREMQALANQLAAERETAGDARRHGFAKELQESRQVFEGPLQKAQEKSLLTQADIATEKAARERAAVDVWTKGSGSTGNSGGGGVDASDRQKFVESIRPYAEKVSRETGVDVRVVIAQAALESRWGTAAPGNNYFGIKGDKASPNVQLLDTTEVGSKGEYKTKEPFRKYDSPDKSFDDYAKFINENGRYAPMRSAKGLDAQIEALGRSGYATDPDYGKKIGQIARSLPGSEGGNTSKGGETEGGKFPSGMPDYYRRAIEATMQSGNVAVGGQMIAAWEEREGRREDRREERNDPLRRAQTDLTIQQTLTSRLDAQLKQQGVDAKQELSEAVKSKDPDRIAAAQQQIAAYEYNTQDTVKAATLALGLAKEYRLEADNIRGKIVSLEEKGMGMPGTTAMAESLKKQLAAIERQAQNAMREAQAFQKLIPSIGAQQPAGPELDPMKALERLNQIWGGRRGTPAKPTAAPRAAHYPPSTEENAPPLLSMMSP